MLQDAQGGDQDMGRAVDAVAEAYEEGDTCAIFQLALYNHFGRGIPQNLEVALGLYTEFLQAGETEGAVPRPKEQGYLPAQQ